MEVKRKKGTSSWGCGRGIRKGIRKEITFKMYFED